MKNVYKRALERERKAKLIAEEFIEKRLRDLYLDNVNLNSNLKDQAEFQKNLLDNLVDAFFVVDFDGNFLKLNKEARKLIGCSKENAPKSFGDFSSTNRKKILEKLDKKTSDRSEFEISFYNRKKEFKVVTIKTEILTRIQNNKKQPYAYQAIVRDITSNYRLDQKLKEQYRMKKFEALILKDLLKSNDIFNNAWTLVNHIADFLKTDDCVFYGLVNNKLIQLAATGHKISSEKTILNKLKIPITEGIIGEVARTKKGIIVKDTTLHDSYIIDVESRLSEIAVPILLDDELIGVIDSEHLDKNFYKKTHLSFLSNISSLIAFQIKNSVNQLEKRLKQDELEKTRKRLEIIFNSDHNAEVIESNDGYIIDVGNSFFKIFGMPLSMKKDLLGTHCSKARKNLQGFFVDEDSYSSNIIERISNAKPVLNEVLELKDGRFLARDYVPIYFKGELESHVWRFRDITLNVNYEKSIEAQNRKYKGIIGNMNLGLMEIDNNDIILTVNKAFCDMYGYNSKELLGKKAEDSLLNNKSYLSNIDTTTQINISDSVICEIEIVNKNGDVKYWLVSRALNKNINDKTTGSICVYLDITELKQLNLKNEGLIKNLIASNEELSHYAHLVSHDLKTPLRTISTCAYWLQEDNNDILSAESNDFISTINDTLKDMDKLITSTLQFAEIRMANSSIDEKIDLNAVLETYRKNKFLDSDDEFTFTIEKPLPTIVFNRVQIQQVFQNLVDNSYKYKDEQKQSYVKINWEEQEEFLLFKISDNGIGIAKEHSSFVFEIFKKVGNRTDSSGVGLWIIKKIINSAGGKIWFDSKLGVGTTFYFTIKKQ